MVEIKSSLINHNQVRINSVESGLLLDDLKVIAKIQSKINGLIIPKVEGPSHLVCCIFLLLSQKLTNCTGNG